MPCQEGAYARARSIIATVQRDKGYPTYTMKLQVARRQLRRDLSRHPSLGGYLERLLRCHAAGGGQQRARNPRGRPVFRNIMSPEDLDACCKEVKTGHYVNGEIHGCRWSQPVLRQLPVCSHTMRCYGIKDIRTLMTAMRQHDKTLKIVTPRIKPAFTPAQKTERLHAAEARSWACWSNPKFHRQVFMVDESQCCRSKLIGQVQGREVVPEGVSADTIQVEPRLTAGAKDPPTLSMLVVVNSCVGPTAFLWLNRPSIKAKPRMTVSTNKSIHQRHSSALPPPECQATHHRHKIAAPH